MASPSNWTSNIRAIDDNARLKFTLLALLIAGLTAVLTVVVIRQSFRIGRLATVPQYDDVVYFISALTWLSEFPNRTLGASLYALLNQHAPAETVLDILGFLIVPEGYAGPYLVRTLFVAGFLAAIARFMWGFPFFVIAASLAAAASVPVLGPTITEARPDLVCGLMLATGIYAVIRRPLVERSLSHGAVLGVFLGLAIVFKLATLPANIAYVGVAVALALLCDWHERGRKPLREFVREAWKISAVLTLGILVVLLPFLVLHFTRIVQYILTVLIFDREFWIVDRDVLWHLNFFLYGMGGKAAFRTFFWIGLVAFMLRLVIAHRYARTDLPRAVLLIAVLLWMYIVPTVNEVKSYFFAAPFYSLFVMALAVNLGVIFTWLSNTLIKAMEARRVQASAGAARTISPAFLLSGLWFVAFIGLATFELASGRSRLATEFRPSDLQNHTMITAHVWQALLDRQKLLSEARGDKLGNHLRVAFSSPEAVRAGTIELYATRQRVPIAVVALYFSRTVEESLASIRQSDLAVVPSAVPGAWPSYRMGNELIEALDKDPAVCLIDSFAQRTEGVVRIYQSTKWPCPAKP